METVKEELKTELISTKEADITHSVMDAAENGVILEFSSPNGQERSLMLNRFEYGEVGFERKSDWLRFCNKLNKNDETPIKRLITGDKKCSDWGALTVCRQDITYTEDGFKIKFKEPVKLVLDKIGDKLLTVEVTELEGKITWEWSFYARGNTISNVSEICEIYITDVNIIK